MLLAKARSLALSGGADFVQAGPSPHRLDETDSGYLRQEGCIDVLAANAVAFRRDKLKPLTVVNAVPCFEVPLKHVDCDFSQTLTSELSSELDQRELVLEPEELTDLSSRLCVAFGFCCCLGCGCLQFVCACSRLSVPVD